MRTIVGSKLELCIKFPFRIFVHGKVKLYMPCMYMVYTWSEHVCTRTYIHTVFSWGTAFILACTAFVIGSYNASVQESALLYTQGSYRDVLPKNGMYSLRMGNSDFGRNLMQQTTHGIGIMHTAMIQQYFIGWMLSKECWVWEDVQTFLYHVHTYM